MRVERVTTRGTQIKRAEEGYIDLSHDDLEFRNRVFDSHLLQEPVSVLRMRTPVVLSDDHTVVDAVREMQRKHRGVVLVTEDGTRHTRLSGIFTERDILVRIIGCGADGGSRTMGEVMTPDPESLPLEATVAWALNKMSVGGFRHVPVVDSAGRPAFVVSVRDVVEFLVEAFPTEILNLPPEFDLDRYRTREGA
jgi:CBS domain-containing protein